MNILSAKLCIVPSMILILQFWCPVLLSWFSSFVQLSSSILYYCTHTGGNENVDLDQEMPLVSRER